MIITTQDKSIMVNTDLVRCYRVVPIDSKYFIYCYFENDNKGLELGRYLTSTQAQEVFKSIGTGLEQNTRSLQLPYAEV